MEYSIKISQNYFGIPIQPEQPEENLEVFLGTKRLFAFNVPVCKDLKERKFEYYSYINVEKYKGQTLTLRGDFDREFFEAFCQKETREQEPLKRPLIHFTAQRGWINDPNGLVYHNGTYHLYFQYNPVNTQWQNMSWGHSVSRDLLHFEQTDDALYPDRHGTAYSGCGLVNDRGLLGLPKDALLFYYTAAGGLDAWSRSEGAGFTQRIAYSLDEGQTLIRLPEAAIEVLREDSRDPKIFWHEETKAYVMVLWLEGNEFGIFRSANLKDWEMSHSFVLEEAWECPDLFPLDHNGERVWVFTSADGFYYLGSFDGYRFETDGVQRKAYLTRLPYAAQTYSNTPGRVISVPWLRTRNVGRLYTGMMGLPRELGIAEVQGEKTLSLLPVKEYEEAKVLQEEFSWGTDSFETELQEEAVAELVLNLEEGSDFQIQLFNQSIGIHDNAVFYKDERTVLPQELNELHILIDRDILELFANHGTMNLWYETDSDLLHGKIQISGGKGTGKLYTSR